jgi:hypothetical protein
LYAATPGIKVAPSAIRVICKDGRGHPGTDGGFGRVHAPFSSKPRAQGSGREPALALARDQVDVADELGAALAAFQHDLAAVEGLQLDAMATLTMVAFGSSW